MIKSFASNRLSSYLDAIFVSVWPSFIHIEIRTPFKYYVKEIVSSNLLLEPLEIYPTLNLGVTGLLKNKYVYTALGEPTIFYILSSCDALPFNSVQL